MGIAVFSRGGHMSPKSLYTIEYRRERRRRVLGGWALVGIGGAVMAVVHMITHLGRLRIIGLQDLLLGYPMAALLILVGFFSRGPCRQNLSGPDDSGGSRCARCEHRDREQHRNRHRRKQGGDHAEGCHR